MRRVSLRAAEDIVEFAKEFISLEDHERRIRELEERLEQKRKRDQENQRLHSELGHNRGCT